jgi:hypothetical protein
MLRTITSNIGLLLVKNLGQDGRIVPMDYVMTGKKWFVARTIGNNI